MTPEEFLAEAQRRLAAEKYAVEAANLRGLPAVIGRKKPFRVRWVLTQLKTSVVVCTAPSVSYAGWEAFLHDAFEIGRAIKGGLPTGFQAGIGVVPVLAATSVDPDAATAATGKPRVEWFTGLSMPALVDLTTNRVHAYEGSQIVGRIYVPFLRKQRDLVTSIVASH